jgi:type IV pilus assembly protein PilA
MNRLAALVNKPIATAYVVLVLAACGGGGLGPPQDPDAAMQARWNQNISEVAQVRSAIAECAKNNGGMLAYNCDSLASLASNGFLPRGDALLAAGRFESAAPTLERATAALVLVGNEEAGNCTLRITPSAYGQTVAWTYTNEAGGRCDRIISTKVRWSENIAEVARVQTAIAECSKKHAGVLAGHCDTLALLTLNESLPAGYTLSQGEFETAVPVITGGTAALVLVGTALAGNCIVTIAPSPGVQSMTWAYINTGITPDGEKCDRTKTGVGGQSL